MIARIPVVAEAPQTDDAPSMTISEFCIAERISTASYHKLQRTGLGPATLNLPGTRIIRITSTARREWQTRMAALSQHQAAKLEACRRQQQASMAGKLAVASPAHVSKRGK